jgi:hypothetical protein
MYESWCTAFHAFSALKYLPERLLRQVLVQYEPELRAVGLAPDRTDAQTLWRQRDHLPRPLTETLLDLHEVSDGQGLWDLWAAAQRAACVLPKNELPIVVAVSAWLRRPVLLKEALLSRCLEPSPPFFELVGTKPGTLPREPREDLEHVRGRLMEAFAERALGGPCQLHEWREGDLHCFLIRHAYWRRTTHEACHSRVITREGWPATHNLVVYDARRHRLRVAASNQVERTLYAEVFGAWLFGDPCWFRPGQVVRLGGLLGPQARTMLTPTRELRAVRLVELEYDQGIRGTRRIRGQDVLRALDDGSWHPEHARPLSVHLELQPRNQSLWYPVRLQAPDSIAGHWRADALVRSFLEERGLLAR